MRYKYHNHSIFMNYQNLICVYYVFFDGYFRGNDTHILSWSKKDLEDFKSKAYGLSDASQSWSYYHTMVAMTLQSSTYSLLFSKSISTHVCSIGTGSSSSLHLTHTLMELCSYFVSARTNKRHHHHQDMRELVRGIGWTAYGFMVSSCYI